MSPRIMWVRASILIEFTFPWKKTGRVFQTEGKRKEAADLIPTLNGCLFGWVQMNLQERTYSNALLDRMIG